MSYLRDTVIILRHEPFREHDARITMFGRTLGKRMAVARGARRMEAKHLGHLEPLSEVEMMIAQGIAFDKIAVARLVRPRQTLRQDLAGLAIGGAYAHLVELMTRPDAPDEVLYDLLREILELASGLQSFPSVPRGRLVFAAATLKLLDLSGYAPHFDECLFCRVSLVEPVWLLEKAGGLICEACVRKEPSARVRKLPVNALRLLRFLRAKPLRDVLSLTASTDLFHATSAIIESALEQAPLHEEPHSLGTLMALLRV